MKLVSLSDLAELTGMTWRTVKKRLSERGIEPRKQTAKSALYASDVALASLYASAASESEELDPIQERARKDKESADKLAMDNEERRGETVRTVTVVEEVGGYISTCCTRLREIAGKSASEFDPATGRRVETTVSREVEYAIAELREYRPVGRAGLVLDA